MDNASQNVMAALDEAPEVKVFIDGKERMVPGQFTKPAAGAISRGRKMTAKNVQVEPAPMDGFYFVKVLGDLAWIAVRTQDA